MNSQLYYPGFKLKLSTPGPGNGFLQRFIQWSWIILSISSLLQLIFFPNSANVVAIACVLIAWLILTKFFLKSIVLNLYPLSTFLIIGFTSTQFYFPLLFTLLEGKPVVFNLELPYQVFFHSIAALIVLVLAHFSYRQIAKPLRSKKSSLLNKAGFFLSPNELQIWLMGLIGLMASFYVHLYARTAGQATGAASDKLIEALVPFSYAPFFIPFGLLYGDKKEPNSRLIKFLLLYTLILFVVSIARNSRGAFMLGFTSVGFCYALGLLLGYYKIRIFTIKNLFIAVVGFWLFTGPIADLGTAMVIVRQQRSDIPYSELLDLTLDAFNDKEAIQLARAVVDIPEPGEWDEYYLDNIFIARFSNIKFNDISLLLSSKLSNQDPDILNYTVDHFLATLPSPVLGMLGVNIDKESVNSVSFGDYLTAKVNDNPYVLGSFLTGHFAGTGMAAFGWWYLAILGVGMVPVYLLFDKLTFREIVPITSSNSTYQLRLRISLCGLLALTSVFQFLPVESVEAIGAFLLRGWLQMILLYSLLYHFTRRLIVLVALIAPSSKVSRWRQEVD